MEVGIKNRMRHGLKLMCPVIIFLLVSCWTNNDFERDHSSQTAPDVIAARRPLLFGKIGGTITDENTGNKIDNVKVIYNVFVMGNDGIYKDDVLISSQLPDQVFTFTNRGGEYNFSYQTVWINPGQREVELMIDLECHKDGYVTLNPLFFTAIPNPTGADTIAAGDIVYDLIMNPQ